MSNLSLKKNYLYNTSYQILAIILPVITTPYVSRVLNPAGIGLYSYSYSIAYIFTIFATLGTNLYAVREISRLRDNIKERSRLFYEIFIIRFVAVLIVTPIYMFTIYLQPYYRNMLIIQYMIVFAVALDVSWFCQGVEDFRTISLRNVLVKIATLLFVFIFVKKEEDVYKYAFILSISNIVSGISLWPYLKSHICRVKLVTLRPLRHLKAVLLLFLPMAAAYIYTSVDKIILGILSTEEQVGYYTQSEKIVKLLMTIITSLGTVLIPRMSNLLKNNKFEEAIQAINKSINFVLFLGVPMVCGVIVVAPRFIPIFLGTDYNESIILMQALAPLIVIIGLSSVTGQAVLVPINKQGIYTVSMLMGALVNIICNIILIPHFDAIGAVIGTIFAESTVFLIQFIAVVKYFKLDLHVIIKENWRSFFSSVCMIVVINCIDRLVSSDIICLFAMIAIGIFIYVTLMILTKDPLITICYRKMSYHKRKNV